jgi:hypothetical protein
VLREIYRNDGRVEELRAQAEQLYANHAYNL